MVLRYTLLTFIHFAIFSQVTAQKEVVLRYSEASCDTLVPTPTEENYAGFNLGPTTEVNDILSENEDSAFDSPKELTSRNPPFDIQLTFSRYRAGKEYEIKIIAEEVYDSFILEIRGRREQGNVTYPGKWVQIPKIAKTMTCDRFKGAAVVDKGLPVRLSNLTFIWQAPNRNVGSIRAVASVANKNIYQKLMSREIRHETFPIPISECGKSLGCFRHCKTEPECEADDTELIVTMGMDDRADPKQPEIEFRIGGKLFDNKSDFVALGLGQSYYNLNNLDIVTCTRDGKQMELGHYFIENQNSEPFEHRAFIRLLDSGIDEESGLSWCSFTRPMRPETPLDLDLTDKLYHFYFKGRINDSRLIMPKANMVQKSGFKFNITEPFVDIRYTGTGSVTSCISLFKIIVSIVITLNLL